LPNYFPLYKAKTPTTACKRRHQSTWRRLHTPMNCVLTEYCLPCGRQSEMPSLLNEWWEHNSSCVPTIFVLALTCVTFTDSLWEKDKWQVHRSHNTITIHDSKPFHKYTSLRKADLQLTVPLLLREGHAVAQLVQASRKVAGSIPHSVIGISH